MVAHAIIMPSLSHHGRSKYRYDQACQECFSVYGLWWSLLSWSNSFSRISSPS